MMLLARITTLVILISQAMDGDSPEVCLFKRFQDMTWKFFHSTLCCQEHVCKILAHMASLSFLCCMGSFVFAVLMASDSPMLLCGELAISLEGQRASDDSGERGN